MKQRIIIFCYIILLALLLSYPAFGGFFSWPDFVVYQKSLSEIFFLYSDLDFWTIKDAFSILNHLYHMLIGTVVWYENIGSAVLFLNIVLYLHSIRYVLVILKENVFKKQINGMLYMVILTLAAFWIPLLWYILNFQTIAIPLYTAFWCFSWSAMIKYLYSSKSKYFIISILLLFFIAHPPTLFIFIGINVLYLLRYKRIKSFIMYIILVLLFQSYWIFPFAYGNIFHSTSSFLWTWAHTSHIFEWHSSSVSVINNLLFSIYPSNKVFTYFSIWVYQFVFSLLIFLFLYYLIFYKNHLRQNIFLRNTIFVFFLLIFFSFWAKYVFWWVFLWLWDHVSLMHFFRHFTMVLNPAYILFLSIIAYVFVHIKLFSKYKLIIFTWIIFLLLFNFFSGYQKYADYIHGNFLPQQYKSIVDIVKRADYRLIEWPYVPYIYYQWYPQRDIYIMKWKLDKLISLNSLSNMSNVLFALSDEERHSFFIDNQVVYYLHHYDYFDKFNFQNIDFPSIYYDVLFTHDLFTLYKLKKEYIIDKIYVKNVPYSYTKKRDYSYTINIPAIYNKFDLKATYWTPYWSLALIPFLESNFVLWKESYELVSNWYNFGFNSWTIDPDYIKKNFPKEYYKENPDGSIDVTLTLYFKPQSYFYLGICVSGLTFLGLIVWLLVDWRREKKLLSWKSEWKNLQL